jgi:hypothetical protein
LVEALVMVSVDSVFNWMKRMDMLLELLRKISGDGRQLIVVLARGNFAVSPLSFSGVSSFFRFHTRMLSGWIPSISAFLEGNI